MKFNNIEITGGNLRINIQPDIQNHTYLTFYYLCPKCEGLKCEECIEGEIATEVDPQKLDTYGFDFDTLLNIKQAIFGLFLDSVKDYNKINYDWNNRD